VIRHCLYEIRLAIHPAIWLLPIPLAILRLVTGASLDRLFNFFGFIYPLLFPIAVIGLLRREKGDRTLEVLIATPHLKATILLIRLMVVILPLFCAIVATVTPADWLSILSPSLLLAMLALLAGLIWTEEVGLAVALGWWAISFAVNFTQMGVLRHPVASWFFLFLLGAGLSPEAFLLRELGHLVASAILLSVSIVLAENWPRPVFPARFRSK